MELIIKTAEMVAEKCAEAAAETATEAVKAGESVDKNLSFGRLGTGDCGKLGTRGIGVRGRKGISFGSLANGELKNNENYLKWKDGIDMGEVDPEWIEELSNEISAIYGNDILTVDELPGIFNAGIYKEEGRIVYDPEYFAVNGNEHGEDFILGSLSHEVGHKVVAKLGLLTGENAISKYEEEACADYIAGLTARLCDLDPTHRMSWYMDRSPVTGDGVHPGSSVRLESFVRGLTRIDRGDEATTLRVFEKFSPYDLEKTYHNEDLLREILYEEVINPLRNGEIKKV